MPVIINGSTGISGTDGSASTPAVQGTDTNTGMFFPGNDRIAFAEGGMQVGEFDASGNFLFNSGYGSVARAFGCRAWVNFNGQGTVAIRASGNVSSIGDLGVGRYQLNFTNSMPDNFYSAVGTDNQFTAGCYSYATGSVNAFSNNTSGVGVDASEISVAVFR